jgi:hypothetical protein
MMLSVSELYRADDTMINERDAASIKGCTK